MAVILGPGDPAPSFIAPGRYTPNFAFDSTAGRYIVLSFIGSTLHPGVSQMLSAIARRKDVFNDQHASFLAVSVDRRDTEESRIVDNPPGLYLLLDPGVKISEAYGVAQPTTDGRANYSLTSFVLDPSLRVLATLPITDPARHGEIIAEVVAALPKVEEQARPAPVLVLPRVFEPEFCQELIAYYNRVGGGIDSGFMREKDGKTIGMVDHSFKRRLDCKIEDDALTAAIRMRLERRLVPEIRRSFNFRATRLERYIVACYESAQGGYFKPHRDNTTRGTAHRRFAVTINLNANAYEGGDLRFPEYGPQTYRAPTGGACVFSCSILHEATPVTSGTRYCFLPFLYDEEGEKIRTENLKFLAVPPDGNPQAAMPPEIAPKPREQQPLFIDGVGGNGITI